MEIEISVRWNKYLEAFQTHQQDIYYREEYVRLYETGEDTAACFVCYENEKVLLMPFLWRKVGQYYDFETPYGYGGPISNSKNKEWNERAIKAMIDYFAQQNYICGFIRFHPLLDNAQICERLMDVILDRSTIAISLVESEEQIWQTQISSKNRNMIRKAEKNGMKFSAEYDFKSLDEFIDLYNATMHRVQAESFYYFSQSYYKSFTTNLKRCAFLGTVRIQGELVCAALFMYSDRYGHYHLSGGGRAGISMGANNLMLWRAALEMRKLGVSVLHLGGGTSAEAEDSLYKFKKSFSKNGHSFYIGKAIFNPGVYEEVCTRWRMKHPERMAQYGNRLLCYRY